MIYKYLFLLVIVLGMLGTASLVYAAPPPTPPADKGQQAPPCHGANNNTCREDPNPDKGRDCFHSDDHTGCAQPTTVPQPTAVTQPTVVPTQVSVQPTPIPGIPTPVPTTTVGVQPTPVPTSVTNIPVLVNPPVFLPNVPVLTPQGFFFIPQQRYFFTAPATLPNVSAPAPVATSVPVVIQQAPAQRVVSIPRTGDGGCLGSDGQNICD